MVSRQSDSLAALREFAAAAASKSQQTTHGEPEDQLRGPFEQLLNAFARISGLACVCTGEAELPNRLGKPDFAIHVNQVLAGYAELKAPGIGAVTSRFSGRNREQWERFKAIPNLLYADGNEWALYRSGEPVGKPVHLAGDIRTDGPGGVAPVDADRLFRLVTDFFSWSPVLPIGPGGKIGLKGLAGLLAPLCRYLRDAVAEAARDPESALVHLAKDWRQILFPEADNAQFADAYAQTVTFALLLARGDVAGPLTLESAIRSLSGQHSLLARALQVLTDATVLAEISPPVRLLVRIISAIPASSLAANGDPWLYFYEDFLAAYDPELRKDAGAYYTPVDVVRAQVRLVDEVLKNDLGRHHGFASPGVVTLDPAVGTGTYLLGVIEHAVADITHEQGKGAVAGHATALAGNLYGFEMMVGPYAVAELRMSRALQEHGAVLPSGGSHIYLTDTLESPDTAPPQLSLFLKPIADQHAKALKVKSGVPVIVCLGNPPYDRHAAASAKSRAQTGGWVRWGNDNKGTGAILRDFIAPAAAAGQGVHTKNLYNFYVYFWRWALWKVFENKSSPGPGVVSFISASSYLEGAAFSGMREYMRRLCDDIWIIDLGGEGRGTRRSDNIFAIQTPVAIAVAVKTSKARKTTPARVRYARIEGTREEKLAALGAIRGFKSLKWRECPSEWQAPFRPAGRGKYFSWPLMVDIMPWQHSGVECKRTWPIAVDEGSLRRRWTKLLRARDRGTLFRETSDRLISGSYPATISAMELRPPLDEVPAGSPIGPVHRCGFRSFDRQHLIADERLISRPRPALWRTYSSKQVYLASSLVLELNRGPALTASACIPDRHYFCGRGGKDILPLFRDARATEPNILPGLLESLGQAYKRKVSPDQFFSYAYGLLAQPAFTSLYAGELASRELRVPITKSAALFEKMGAAGAHLLWLHTYGERYVPKGKKTGHIPRGLAKCENGVPGTPEGYPESFTFDPASKTLHVGGGQFRPVSREIYEFEVSGLKVVQSWLRYRMKKGAGKKSSPLDDIRPEVWTPEFTTELLELLWVLEATLASYPDQAKLLAKITEGPCFHAGELPPVSPQMRAPPARSSTNGELNFDDDDTG